MSAALDDLLLGEVVDANSVIIDFAAVWFLKKAYQTDKGALAGSGEAYDAENLV